MRYSHISGLESSKIILGTDGFGERVDEKTAFDIMDSFVSFGGNHIDTARLYGDGASEAVIGKWLMSKKRDELIIATKGAHPPIDRMDIPRLSLADIESDLDKSLKALKTDYIDLYWLHRDNTSVSAQEITDSMNILVKKGKIRYFGASNWKSDRINAANTYAQNNSLDGFCAGQIRFGVASTSPGYVGDTTLVEMDKKEFEFYKNTNLCVMGFASQAKGFFSKFLSLGEEGLSTKAKERYYCPENVKKAEKISLLSKKYGVSAAAIVCAALTSIKSINAYPIIGSKSVIQLADSLDGADITLVGSELEEIVDFV